MSEKNLGIIGGGQLGSMLSTAAKKLNIKTTIFVMILMHQHKIFVIEFIYGKYDDKEKILEFIKKLM